MSAVAELLVVSVVTRSHLGDARTLARTLRRWHPGARFVVLVVDEMERTENEGFEVLLLEDLAIPDVAHFRFQYTAFELCNALKAHVLEWVFTKTAAPAVLYLDSDVGVCGDLSELWRDVCSQDVLVTPHQTVDFPEDGMHPSAWMIRNAGVFNAGVLGVRRSPGGMAFVGWWKKRMLHDCIVDKESDLFVDQRHLDAVTASFPRASVCRHPGVNVGHFNLHYRTLRREGDRWFANDHPLLLFHFTSVDYEHGGFLAPINRPLVQQQPLIRDLIAEYAADRTAVDSAGTRRTSYGFARLASGRMISPETRRAFRLAWMAGGEPLDPHLNPKWDRYESRGWVRRLRAALRRRVVRLL